MVRVFFENEDEFNAYMNKERAHVYKKDEDIEEIEITFTAHVPESEKPIIKKIEISEKDYELIPISEEREKYLFGDKDFWCEDENDRVEIQRDIAES